MVGDVAALVKSGELRILAIAAEQRFKDYPEIPTYREKGVDIGIIHWRGIWALKAIPEPTLVILEEAIRKAANSERYKNAMAKAGYYPDNVVDRKKLKERLESEDRVYREALKALKMLEE
jgi:tripartite-type tricarboxylate transporter receptor subunit TctC